MEGMMNDDGLYVDFLNSTTIFLPNILFDTFRNLNRLHAENVNLKTLSNRTFQNCSNLKTLNLLKNNIKSIPGDTFAECYNLGNINLQSNALVVTGIDLMLFFNKFSVFKLLQF